MLGTGKGTEYYLRIQDFDYKLPPESIAAHPATRRDGSRLMVLARQSGQWKHARFFELSRALRPRSLLVVNDTRVIPARLRARKPTGGAVEVLLVRARTDGYTGSAPTGRWSELWEAIARGVGSSPDGTRLTFADGVEAEIVGRVSARGGVLLRFEGTGAGGVLAAADRLGSVPLPPYIEAARRRGGDGTATDDDRVRYQTVYARAPGAVAAPTAGLHFTPELLAELRAAGHQIEPVTLHVGPGTFRPVECEDPREHQLDPEPFEVPPATAAAINRARAEGRPVVAVGTTVVRTLEAAGAGGDVLPGAGWTDLYLVPGARFAVVTDLITNFHLPRSTLLMLVAAFAGRERVLAAYQEAVHAGYRFYSYGDAMFIRAGDELPP
jgi:S-adenosylmethionine:tRNA ribosyltransferase-isomerase